MIARATFAIKNAAVFQCKYVGFTVLKFTKVVADFQPLQVLCERPASVAWKKQTRIKPTLGILLLKGLVHALKLGLSLLRKLLLPFLAFLYPLQGIVCVRIGVTQSSPSERRIEFSFVSHPANIA